MLYQAWQWEHMLLIWLTMYIVVANYSDCNGEVKLMIDYFQCVARDRVSDYLRTQSWMKMSNIVTNILQVPKRERDVILIGDHFPIVQPFCMSLILAFAKEYLLGLTRPTLPLNEYCKWIFWISNTVTMKNINTFCT